MLLHRRVKELEQKVARQQALLVEQQNALKTANDCINQLCRLNVELNMILLDSGIIFLTGERKTKRHVGISVKHLAKRVTALSNQVSLILTEIGGKHADV